MKLNKQNLNNLYLGSSFLATGGGGRLDIANKMMKSINSKIEVSNIEDINNNDLIITTYGVGNLKKSGNFKKIIEKNLNELNRLLNRKIKYLIPVEMGPVSVMVVLLFSSLYNLPVVNGDLVGYRSSPEIYLEGMTLNDVNRLPLIASNSEKEYITILNASSVNSIEKILRKFSFKSKSKIYVTGYPLTKRKIINFFGNGSISYALQIGKILKNSNNNFNLIDQLNSEGIIYLDKGKIIQQEEIKIKGFTGGRLTIKSDTDEYNIIYKNEFLILIKNNELFFTCPDSILLLDSNKKIGINNGENNIGKYVMIFAKIAEKYWRSKQGLKLFSPKNIGLNFKQKLLNI